MSKLTPEDVVDYLEDTHNYGGNWWSLCPFHPDTSPSFHVTESGYRCWSTSCGVHGSLEKLYHHLSGNLVKREKVYNPAAWIWKGWAERFGSIQNIAKLAHRELINHPENGKYLKDRKIDSQIEKGMFGYLDGYYLFPIKDEYLEVKGIVARASPTIQTKRNRYSVSPNCPVKLYIPDWRKVLKSESLYVPFGTIDAWTLEMAGYSAVTGISGQELNPANLDRFRVPMYNVSDKGEENKGMELQPKLGWRMNCLWIDWNQVDGCKDLNEIHVKFGIEKVIELIELAKRRYTYDK